MFFITSKNNLNFIINFYSFLTNENIFKSPKFTCCIIFFFSELQDGCVKGLTELK